MSKIITDEKLIDELLTHGVAEVIVKEELAEKMLSGKKLRIKLGIDPTGSVLHLGHAVVLQKLKQFQDLGHQVIFLIGDFTARIGDPTGRSASRKSMTEEEINNNMQDYVNQASKILDINKVELRYNSEWLAKLDFKELIILASKVTYAQVAQRADFKDRIKNDVDLSLQEFLYPLMQGYDSVMLKSDVEIGGTDQKFNLLMGRQLQKRYKQASQDIITCSLLEGLSGEEKMSKSLNNYVALNENPGEMFGKIMSLSDNLMPNYYKLCTNIFSDEIEKEIKENPRDAKMKLASEIVKIYHGEAEAKKAKDYFIKTFSKREIPNDILVSPSSAPEISLIDYMVEAGKATSKSDARRKIEQGGVELNGKKIGDWKMILSSEVHNDMTLKVGKFGFVKIKF
jgi:tyrosyl-tRNA synthetase